MPKKDYQKLWEQSQEKLSLLKDKEIATAFADLKVGTKEVNTELRKINGQLNTLNSQVNKNQSDIELLRVEVFPNQPKTPQDIGKWYSTENLKLFAKIITVILGFLTVCVYAYLALKGKSIPL